LRANADLSPALIARAIAATREKDGRGWRHGRSHRCAAGHCWTAKERAMKAIEVKAVQLKADRQPWFCSGARTTPPQSVPEGSRAMAGIGCHFMAIWMDRSTVGFTQMGGEGVPWVGQAPFTTDQHIFANLGDGTYFHSGLLAVRQSIAAGVNITYKILYNDAVAMTGGQQVGERPEGPQRDPDCAEHAGRGRGENHHRDRRARKIRRCGWFAERASPSSTVTAGHHPA
jgi:indolepyruvate ferredoxin oxidoreductase